MKGNRRLLAVVVSAAMVFSLVPITAMAAEPENVTLDYIDEYGDTRSISATPLTDSVDVLDTGWYAVTEDVTISERISVNGAVDLILCDGATLTAPKGIGVDGGQSLTIWGQTNGNGELAAGGEMYNAGIGGTDSDTGENPVNGGTVTVNGGTVMATGGAFAAGIGGTRKGSGCSVTINGGTVTATGDEYSAGIGGGYVGDATVTINGGIVTVTGGIGSGKAASGSTITLNWTNADDCITADSYSGSVTMARAFEGGSTIYPAGTIHDNSSINGVALRPCADTHDIQIECVYENAVGTPSSTVTLGTSVAPAGYTVTLTVNTAPGEKLSEQQQLGEYPLSNGFFAYYMDENGVHFITFEKNGDSYSFEMPDSDITIGAFFTCIDYSIVFNEPIYGDTAAHIGDSLETASTAHAGDTINVLFTADSNDPYTVTEMTYAYTEDGTVKNGTMQLTNVDEANIYFLGTFTMPASDVRISITYEGSHRIRYDSTAGMSLKQDKYSEVAGKTVTLTPYEGFDVSSVSVKCGQNDVDVTKNANGTFSFVMPDGDVDVSAEYVCEFYYVDRTWNATTKEVESTVVNLDPSALTPIGFSETLYTNGTDLIYVARNTTSNDRWTISGNMRLVIADGATLTCSKGIAVNNGATLSIYGQNEDSGMIIANAEDYNAAIGSDDQDTTSGANGGGTINIYGGTIVATGGSDAAAIGGGNEAGNGNITIYGGTVTATGGTDAAGIGTGDEPETTAGDIKIYGGTVTAQGDDYGAGIGGGDAGKGGRIYIYGGTVNATGGDYGAGIGGGEDSVANCIQIDGGTVNASGGQNAAGIGTGTNPSNNNGKLESIVINGGVVNATSGYNAAAIGTGYDEDFTSGSITINGGTVTTCALYSQGAGIGTGYNSDCGLDITINGGEVYAIEHRNDSDGSEEGAAGIGAGHDGDLTGTITITGGEVHAMGAGGISGSTHYGGAGIGAGYKGDVTSGAQIKISGGTVDARGKNGGAAIGAGAEALLGDGGECEGKIMITGGTVTLTLSSNGNAVYCGHGDDGDANGTFTLPGTFMVHSQGSSPVAASDRAATCQSSNSGVLVIEVCDHQNKTYSYTTSGHTEHCPNCSTSFTEEPHTLNHNGICSVCGYQSAFWIVSFEAGDGSGSMREEHVVSGTDYILPDCGFTAPEGKAFKEWSVVIGEAAAVTKASGDTITVTADTVVTAVWDFPDGIGEKLVGYTLSLDGDIGVNFYMELDADIANSEDAYMEFTVPNGTKTVTQKVYVKAQSDPSLLYATTETVNGRTYYVFKCTVSAKDIGSNILGNIVSGDTTGTTYVYSVKDYAEYILEHGEEDKYSKAVPLVKALLNYGTVAQSYFGIDTSAPNVEVANDTAYMTETDRIVSEVTADSLSDYAYDAAGTNLPEGVTFEGATLSLKSETTLSLYFTSDMALDQFTFSCGNLKVEEAQVGDYKVARIRNINVKDLDVLLTLQVEAGDSSGSISYSPLTYCYNVLNGGSNDENLKTVCRALYDFYQAAEAFAQ